MIFTDRTITVRKGESRIDEPIVVYRGDYELEVRFTILNSKFRFMSGTNLIESEKASYGQLAILTPYGGNIFSDIVRCNDGSVTFVLTAEMLNQIEEVGLYSFQIRLMDYNKESRVSIPPIEFGIEVREPIASEDHDNSVNNAIVGYSIAKVVDPKEENVGDTFDEGGNYNKTKWETGDRISQGKLNKIEDAIDKVNKNEMNNSASLSKRIDNNFNVLYSIKADTSYVDTIINSVASGSPKGVYANIEELTGSFPSGDENVYLTNNDGRWNYWNGSSWVSGGVYQSIALQDNSVNREHIYGGCNSNNAYNTSLLRNGYVNISTLDIKQTDKYRYAKIPVLPDSRYIIARDLTTNMPNNMTEYDPILFMDANSSKIEVALMSECLWGKDLDDKPYAIIDTPLNTSYICLNAKINDFDVAYENGIYVIPYDEHLGFNFSFDSLVATKDIFNCCILDSYARNLIREHKNNIVTTSRNIARGMSITQDALAATNGKIMTSDGWYMGKIAVKPNTSYSIYFGSQIYTASKGTIIFTSGIGRKIDYIEYSNISKVSVSEGRYITITTPNDCKYIHLTLKTPDTYESYYDDRNSTIIVEGTLIADDFINYVRSIDGLQVLNPTELGDFIDIPILSKNGNMLKDNNVIIHYDTLYNSNGRKQTDISGWTAVDVPVTGGNTYYFYSPSGLNKSGYKPTYRGHIVLLNASGNIIQSISNQNINVSTIGEYAYQVIETTELTSYVGITVGAPDNRFSDLDNGSFTDSLPNYTPPMDIYINEINGNTIEANKLSDELTDKITDELTDKITDELTDKLTINYKPLLGKKWVAVGDSLTEFNSRATKNYHDYVAEDTGVTVVNFGVSGSGYKRKQENNKAFYQRILKIPTDADIVTIFGSGNDLSLTLGSPSDTGTDTICGCIHQTIQNLFSVNPGIRVGIVLPCPWGNFPPSINDNKMALYCEALKEIAGYYSIPVLDLYHGSNLRPWDDEFRSLYYKHDDGNTVHPDEDGHALLANKFKMFIMSL